MKPVLKAVLFDMDDTLIDWQGWSGDWKGVEQQHLRGVYNYLTQEQRGLSVEFEAFHEEYGRRSRDAWANARSTLKAPHLGRILMQTLVELGFTEDERIGMAQCLQAYGWGPVPGVVVFEDALKTLDLLTQRGILTGIVTNASQSMYLRDVELEHFDLLKYFPNVDTRISAADVGFLKPHEAIFRRALEALGTTAEETVFVGDNPVADIAGAQSMGMKAVLRILSPAPTLISGLIVPDGALNTLEELPSLLDQWFDW